MTNMSWYRVICFPLSTNLQPLIGYLQKNSFYCRVTEEVIDGRNQQQIWVSTKDRALEVAEICTQWSSGELVQESNAIQEEAAQATITQSTFKVAVGFHLLTLLPVTLGMILLGFIGAALFSADTENYSFIEPFLFLGINGEYLVPLPVGLEAGEYWRFVTPAFIHFGFLHILFNSLIIWEVGRRIEVAKGSVHYLGFILLVAVVSNFSQYSVASNVPFGGLSGIAYGVIGYIAIYQELVKHPVLQFHKGTIAFFIIWLLLGVFGVVDLFIDGSVANAAHISGIITGALFGALVAMIDKAGSKSTSE